MSYNLFLDDTRTPTSDPTVVARSGVYAELEWVVVRSYEEFVQYITENGVPDLVSFDHDLSFDQRDEYDSFEERKGTHAAYWLASHCIEHDLTLPNCMVHSANTVGTENIISIIESAKKVQNLCRTQLKDS